MIDKGVEVSSGLPESEEESARLSAEKLAYFTGVVQELRFSPPRDVAEMRRRNNAIRAQTAASVALKAMRPVTVKGRR